MNFDYCDALINNYLKVVDTPVLEASSRYFCGVDLGTACVVLAVLNEDGEPVAGEYQYANVVKDGMLVDYTGAVRLVKQMKANVEARLGTRLMYAASAIPPGTNFLDSGAIKNVVESADFEVTSVDDEPTAANQVLKMKNGAIVDIGGGTTGISILKKGKVVSVADEPTGGTHFSLVVAGSYRISIEEAELYKRNTNNHKELTVVLKPVIEKVATIINRSIKGHKVDELLLVGGTACFNGIEHIIEEKTGIPTYKPANPMFVTPLGIALSCRNAVVSPKKTRAKK